MSAVSGPFRAHCASDHPYSRPVSPDSSAATRPGLRFFRKTPILL